AEMPEHVHAAESLRQAQHQVAERRQGQEQLEAFVREASAAYDARDYARCLEMLEWVAEHAAPSAEPAEAARLRRAAQAALAREQAEETSLEEARRRASDSAARMRERAEQARRGAEAAEARLDQPHLWGQAETKLAEGRAALAEEAYAPAEKHFDDARQLFERADAFDHRAGSGRSCPADLAIAALSGAVGGGAAGRGFRDLLCGLDRDLEPTRGPGPISARGRGTAARDGPAAARRGGSAARHDGRRARPSDQSRRDGARRRRHVAGASGSGRGRALFDRG